MGIKKAPKGFVSHQRASANTRKAVSNASATYKKQAASNAARARSRADARQAGAVRSATSSTRARTLSDVEKNMGGVQRAGRAVDKGITATKTAYANARAGNTAWQRGANKAVDKTKKFVRDAGTRIGRGHLSDGLSQRGAKRGTTNTIFGNMKNANVRRAGYGIAGTVGTGTVATAKLGYDLATDFSGHESNNPKPSTPAKAPSESAWSRHKKSGSPYGF
jgi:hypothetical protein